MMKVEDLEIGKTYTGVHGDEYIYVGTSRYDDGERHSFEQRDYKGITCTLNLLPQQIPDYIDMNESMRVDTAVWYNWPEHRGHWWFYGWPYRSNIKDYDPELYMCKAVVNAAGHIVVHRYNDFMYRGQAVGLFLPAVLPVVPDGVREFIQERGETLT